MKKIKQWTNEERLEWVNKTLKELRRIGFIGPEERAEYSAPEGWSFLVADIHMISAGVSRQGVCYAFPPGTKFRVGR